MKKVTVELMLNKNIYSYVSKMELNIEGVKKNFEKQDSTHTTQKDLPITKSFLKNMLIFLVKTPKVDKLKVKGFKKELKQNNSMHTILVKRMSRNQMYNVEKRFMRLATTTLGMRNLMFRGSVLKNPEPTKTITRSHTDYSGALRIENPQYQKTPEPMKIDKETGLEVMRPFDASGKNHFLLVDNTFKNARYYLIRGSFTTKATPYNDIPPEMVAPTTFEGKSNPQFFQHYYPKPRLIEKADVDLRADISLILQESPYNEFIDALPDYPQQTP